MLRLGRGFHSNAGTRFLVILGQHSFDGTRVCSISLFVLLLEMLTTFLACTVADLGDLVYSISVFINFS